MNSVAVLLLQPLDADITRWHLGEPVAEMGCTEQWDLYHAFDVVALH